MNGTYEPPSLLPAGGQERTHALLIAGIPLLLILLIAVVSDLSSDDGDVSPPGYGTMPSAPAYGTQTSDVYPSYGTETSDAYPSYGTETTDAYPSYGTETTAETTYGTSGPADTVTAFFDAINRRDYDKAWELGGKNLDASYGSFVAGFTTTERDDVTITSVDGDTVSVNLLAQQTDGTQKSYSGQYTVVDGTITQASMASAD
ncbi:hypothetical protein KBP30_11280 [Streptomyces sp. Go40/10]|uniref:hypothetical protein n=1 Tax=Streptomyces sp. Go40/10 TaxID=2825844 RepID=UPI001E518042|nr:hypothetical protein [Streptomyces sp. Go40/10]UFR01734.1 hypothetical protein KBP30_11280 [Streptomyces sp. Go40/10]